MSDEQSSVQVIYYSPLHMLRVGLFGLQYIDGSYASALYNLNVERNCKAPAAEILRQSLGDIDSRPTPSFGTEPVLWPHR